MESEKSETPPQSTLWQELLARRVPQFVGVYLGASWALIQFVQFLADQLDLSKALGLHSLVILASLLPTVIIMAWFHGKPGRDVWTRVEKIGIPVNLLITAALLMFITRGQELQASSTIVTVEDESGAKIERKIAKSQHRRRIALFNFKNRSGQQELDWLQYGYAELLYYHLYQYQPLDVWGSVNFNWRAEKAGFKVPVGLPTSLQQTIAKAYQLDHFIQGEITAADSTYAIVVRLFETEKRRMLAEKSFADENLFIVAEQAGKFCYEQLGLPKFDDATPPMPLQEVLTASTAAFRNYILADELIELKNEWHAALPFLEQSARDDSLFVNTRRALYAVYLNTGRSEEARAEIEKAMQNIYRLPERSQLGLKAAYYFETQQLDKRLALFRMWAELYPDDADAHQQLGAALFRRRLLEESLGSFHRAYTLNPDKTGNLLNIATVHLVQQQYEHAEKYFTKYAELNPGSANAFRKLGDLNEFQGRFNEAISYYEKASVLEPNSIRHVLNIGRMYELLGDLSKADAEFDRALAMAQIPDEREDAFSRKMISSSYRGQPKRAYAFMKKKLAAMAEHRGPVNYIIDGHLFHMDYYGPAGKSEEGFKVLAEMKKQLPIHIADKLSSMGELFLYLDTGESDSAMVHLKLLDEAVRVFQREDMRHLLDGAEGRIYEQKGEYEKAITAYKNRIKRQGFRFANHIPVGRCYRLLKNYEKAESALQKTLDGIRMHPRANYEMGLLKLDTGDREAARKYFENALVLWAQAEPDFEKAADARARLAELKK